MFVQAKFTKDYNDEINFVHYGTTFEVFQME